MQAAKATGALGHAPLNPVEQAKLVYKKEMDEKLNRRLSTLNTKK